MKITRELIEAGKSERGGWTAAQLALLGVEWPAKHGWQDRVIGKPISGNDAQAFVFQRGQTVRPSKRRSVVKTDLPFPPGFPVKVETVVASFWLYVSKLEPGTKRKVADLLQFITKRLRQ